MMALIPARLHPLDPLPFPGTYIPRKEVEVLEIIQATVIKQNQALRLRARKECWDREGKERVTGAVDGGARMGVRGPRLACGCGDGPLQPGRKSLPGMS